MAKKVTPTAREKARQRRDEQLNERKLQDCQDRLVLGRDGKVRPEPAGKSIFDQ